MSAFRIFCFVASVLAVPPAIAQASLPFEINGIIPGGDSNAVFAMGMRLAGGNTYGSEAGVADTVEIVGLIRPDPAHVGSSGDIFMVDRVNGVFLMQNTDGNFVPWDTRIKGLVPLMENVLLTDSVSVDLFSGTLGESGDHRIYLAYLAEGGSPLQFTPKPLRLTIFNTGTSNPDNTANSGEPDNDDSADSLSGVWSVSETIDARACGEGTSSIAYQVTLVQDGTRLTLTIDGESVTGSLDNNRFNYSTTLSEDGGTTRSNVSVTFAGDTYSGSSSWTYSEDGESCSGTTTVRGARISTNDDDDSAGNIGGGASNTGDSGNAGDLTSIILDPPLFGAVIDVPSPGILTIHDANPDVDKWIIDYGNGITRVVPRDFCSRTSPANTCIPINSSNESTGNLSALGDARNPADWGRKFNVNVTGLDRDDNAVSMTPATYVYTLVPDRTDFTLAGRHILFTTPNTYRDRDKHLTDPDYDILLEDLDGNRISISLPAFFEPGLQLDIECPNAPGFESWEVPFIRVEIDNRGDYDTYERPDCSGSLTIGFQPLSYTNLNVWTIDFSATIFDNNTENKDPVHITGSVDFTLNTLD